MGSLNNDSSFVFLSETWLLAVCQQLGNETGVSAREFSRCKSCQRRVNLDPLSTFENGPPPHWSYGLLAVSCSMSSRRALVR